MDIEPAERVSFPYKNNTEKQAESIFLSPATKRLNFHLVSLNFVAFTNEILTEHWK